MPTRELPIPTFLIIGAQKSATRWLRLNLGAHPDVFSEPREIEFFNSTRYEALGFDWYREQFPGWSGEAFVGEATPGYMFWRHRPLVMAERIRDCMPDARLMAILRNPVDRAQSAVVHHVQMRSLPAGTEVMDYVPSVRAEDDPLGIVSGGWYAASLEPFLEVFGDQLLVLLHDDVDDDPRGVYDRALRHVGLAPDFLPAELARVRFSFQERPSAMPAARELTLDERRVLYELFTDDIRRLEQLIGTDLTRWDPDNVIDEVSSAAAG
jgi:Sulfotransferase domain